MECVKEELIKNTQIFSELEIILIKYKDSDEFIPFQEEKDEIIRLVVKLKIKTQKHLN